tara:strand:+ start:231782 stop:232312 length:531 start_codon:yes stop_codon:yes gene_type:complete
MSNNPNNPFDDNQPNQGYAQGGPPQKKSNTWLWVLGILGALGLVGALVCCGGTFFAYKAGTGMMAEAFKSQLADNPVIEEHIGTIDSMSMSLGKTSEYAESSPGSLAFDISGAKGSGTVLIKQQPGADGQPGIGSAELIMSDGSRHAIEIDGGSAIIDDDFKIDLGEPDAEPAENF